MSLKMKSLSVVLVLGMLAAIMGLQGCQASKPTHVSVKETRNMMAFGVLMLIIDVREPSEFRGPGGHLPDARNYPWNSGVLQRQYHELPPQAQIILVSQRGRRSLLAMEFLRQRGFGKVLTLAGGMNAWDGERQTWSDPNGPPDSERPTPASPETTEAIETAIGPS